MDSVLGHRYRTWWPPHSNSLELSELSDSGPPSQNTNSCHELDLASLMHECFVPLEDLVPCHVDMADSTACVQAPQHVGRHGTSEGNKPCNNGEEDTNDTLHLVSSVLKVSIHLNLSKVRVRLSMNSTMSYFLYRCIAVTKQQLWSSFLAFKTLESTSI